MSLPVSDYLAIEIGVGILLLSVLLFMLIEGYSKHTLRNRIYELKRENDELRAPARDIRNRAREETTAEMTAKFEAEKRETARASSVELERVKAQLSESLKVKENLESRNLALSGELDALTETVSSLKDDLSKVREERANEVSGLKDRLRDLTEKYENSPPETETPKARGTSKTPEAKPKINPKSLGNLRQYRNHQSK